MAEIICGGNSYGSLTCEPCGQYGGSIIYTEPIGIADALHDCRNAARLSQPNPKSRSKINYNKMARHRKFGGSNDIRSGRNEFGNVHFGGSNDIQSGRNEFNNVSFGGSNQIQSGRNEFNNVFFRGNREVDHTKTQFNRSGAFNDGASYFRGASPDTFAYSNDRNINYNGEASCGTLNARGKEQLTNIKTGKSVVPNGNPADRYECDCSCIPSSLLTDTGGRTSGILKCCKGGAKCGTYEVTGWGAFTGRPPHPALSPTTLPYNPMGARQGGSAGCKPPCKPCHNGVGCCSEGGGWTTPCDGAARQGACPPNTYPCPSGCCSALYPEEGRRARGRGKLNAAGRKSRRGSVDRISRQPVGGVGGRYNACDDCSCEITLTYDSGGSEKRAICCNKKFRFC